MPEHRRSILAPAGEFRRVSVAYLQNIGSKLPLRVHLQAGTRTIHDRLDLAAPAAELGHAAGYARFLARQLAARAAIDEWAGQHCPALLCPPPTTALLRADLAELAGGWAIGGRPPPPAREAFALPGRADPLGLAWAIAGSHLGNRAILARMRKAAVPGSPSLPVRFLADWRMGDFWRCLLPRLSEPVSATFAAPALAAAGAVFSRFELAFAVVGPRSRQAA